MITARINVNEIEKHRLFKGEKGIYLNIVLIETPNSDYDDYMIVQEVSKEEREAGTKGKILGNAKILIKEQRELTEEEKDDLPF